MHDTTHAFRLERIHRVNLFVLLGVAGAFLVLRFLAGGLQAGLNDLPKVLSVMALAVAATFLPIPDAVKSRTLPLLPALMALAMFFAEGYSPDHHYIIYASVAMSASYFRARYVAELAVVVNAGLVAAYAVNPTLLFGTFDNYPGAFASVLVTLNGALLVLFLLTRWGRRWIEQTSSLNVDLEARRAELDRALALVSQEQVKLEDSERRYRHLALHDPTTGLENRAGLDEHLRARFLVLPETGGSLALIVIDIDNFRKINDALGHANGDRLLAACADRLRTLAARFEFIGRIGGDEFAFACKYRELSEVEDAANAVLGIFQAPFDLRGSRFEFGASAGIAVYPADGHDGEELLRAAENALAVVKHTGKGRAAFHDNTAREAHLRRLRVVRTLRDALRNDEFSIVVQPQWGVHGDRLRGGEVLVRWTNPELGPVSPVEFIPLAEQEGVIDRLGDWVLDRALELVGRMEADRRGLTLSVNVSPIQLYRGEFPERVRRKLSGSRVDPTRIELEITEGVFIDNFDEAIAVLKRLKDTGARIALDDFGTGYSSLSYLRELPIDILKIDKTFVMHIEHNLRERHVLESVIQLAHKLSLEVVAEGIETEGQRRLLAEMGCNVLQGYLISRPLDEPAWMDYMARTGPAPLT